MRFRSRLGSTSGIGFFVIIFGILELVIAFELLLRWM
jgi:hypothetical protein